MEGTKLIKEAFNRATDNTFVLWAGNILALAAYVLYIHLIVTGIDTEYGWTVLKWITAIITGEVVFMIIKWFIFIDAGILMIATDKY